MSRDLTPAPNVQSVGRDPIAAPIQSGPRVLARDGPARFLGVSHNQLIVPFRNFAGDAEPDFDADGIWQGTCIVRGAEDDEGEPDWAAIWTSGW